MQKAILLLLALFAITNHLANGFILDSIDMDNSTFEQFSSPDDRSDRAGSEIVADALREYMTQNQIKILLDQSNFPKISILCQKHLFNIIKYFMNNHLRDFFLF